MRNLSSTLLAAPKTASHTPYVKVEVTNRIGGVVRLDWARLYTGTEDDCYHAATMPGDGSLVRARVTPPVDAGKLYRQRVASPGPGSDFSQWVYTGQYDALVVAAASLGAEASIFWVKGSRQIYQLKSTDYGATWGSPQLLGYSPTTSVYGMAAAYRPDGDIALFFTDQAILYVMKRTGGSWGSRVAWDKSTGSLSGVATLYDGDWNLLVTGQDPAGNYRLWSLVYGDGGAVTAGSWSALKEVASAPSDGDFEYGGVFLAKPDVYRAFFVEKFSGTASYRRSYWSHTVPGTGFLDSLWREPVPFDLDSEYGLALASDGDYGWLSAPYGVWRAALTPQSLELTADVVSLRQELGTGQGRLVVELRNDDGRYAAPGQGSLALLDAGAELSFSPGYRTAAGNEVSPGQTFVLESYQHTSAGGKASLWLYAYDAWHALGEWRAWQQWRWNKAADDVSVRDLLALVLARVGLKLEVKSQSAAVTGFYPDFTIQPDNRGDAVIGRLLSFVPDLLLVEGNTAYLVNPQAADSPVYSYGGAHPILEGRYGRGGWGTNQVRVEGFNPDTGGPVLVHSFAWEEMARWYQRPLRVADGNISTTTEAEQRGEACLRRAEIAASGGEIAVPVNCGQQLYDVVDITDSRAGLSGARRRVMGLALVYQPRRGEYRQRLQLGAV